MHLKTQPLIYNIIIQQLIMAVMKLEMHVDILMLIAHHFLMVIMQRVVDMYLKVDWEKEQDMDVVNVLKLHV